MPIRVTASLANKPRQAQSKLRIEELQCQYRRHLLLAVAELGCRLVLNTPVQPVFRLASDSFGAESIGHRTSLDFAHLPPTLGVERMAAALLDTLILRIRIVALEGENYRPLQSPQRRPSIAG